MATRYLQASGLLLIQAIKRFNILTGYLSAVIVVITALIVCYGVVMRYVFNTPLDWGLELSIYLLITSTFMSAAYTQLERGHVAIEVLDQMMKPPAIRWRVMIGDLLSLVFCGFLAWNSWHFFLEAFEDGRVTNSMWGPKLWIPYLFMAWGCTTLSAQLVIQIIESAFGLKHKQHSTAPEWKE